MQNDILRLLTRLSDAELLRKVRVLINREREATAELVAHLAELDTREVHLREGYPSLYIYCRDALGLSEWEAYNRIEVARAARRFPAILAWLADGSVTLTTVKLLAPHLTPDNHGDVLQAARHKRKAQVEELVAQLAPRPDVPCSVRQVASSMRQPPTGRAPREAAAHVPAPAAMGSRSCNPLLPRTTRRLPVGFTSRNPFSDPMLRRWLPEPRCRPFLRIATSSSSRSAGRL